MTCPKERGRADGVKFLGGVAGAYRFPAYDGRAYQCWIDEGRVGRVG